MSENWAQAKWTEARRWHFMGSLSQWTWLEIGEYIMIYIEKEGNLHLTEAWWTNPNGIYWNWQILKEKYEETRTTKTN